MLANVRSPGPPWLPVPHFADTATVIAARLPTTSRFVVALALLDRSFRPVCSTPWTTTGEFGLRLGADQALVPSGAQWWAVAVGFPDAPQLRPASRIVPPHETFAVRWGLHL